MVGIRASDTAKKDRKGDDNSRRISEVSQLWSKRLSKRKRMTADACLIVVSKRSDRDNQSSLDRRRFHKCVFKLD